MSQIFYFNNNRKVLGPHDNLFGDYSKLRGDCTNIWGKCFNIRGFVSNLIGDISNINGDVSHIRGKLSVKIYGDFSGIYGDVTGLIGNVSNLKGDLDRCKITPYERKTEIDINYLRERFPFLGTKTYREHYKSNGEEKRGYASYEAVMQHLRILKEHGKNAPVRIYQCSYCSKWHYGQDYD